MEETDEDDDDEEDFEDDVKRLKMSESPPRAAEQPKDATSDDGGVFKVSVAAPGTTTTYDDGIFTVSVAGPSGGGAAAGGDGNDAVENTTNEHDPDIYWPAARMNTAMAVKNGVLFLYGGSCENGNKEITLADFYALDLHKLEEWRVIIKNETEQVREATTTTIFSYQDVVVVQGK